MPSTLTPRAVLFDVYRTLVDIWTDEHHPLVWKRLAWFLRSRGIASARPDELSRRFFERSERYLADKGDNEHPEVDVPAIFREMLAEISDAPPAEAFVDEVTRLFRLLSLRHLELFPDTLPTLEALRPHFALGLVSNAQQIFLDTELAILGLHQWLPVQVISSDYGFQKPDPRLFGEALKMLGAKAEEAVFVGDTVSRDICGAREAGIFAILIDRDDRLTQFEGCVPDLVLSSLDELRWWLLPAAGV